MNSFNNLFSLAVVFLAAWACLAEGEMKGSVSAYPDSFEASSVKAQMPGKVNIKGETPVTDLPQSDEMIVEPTDRVLGASKPASLRSRRMVGGTLAPHVPWQAMIYLSDSVLDGGYAGGALISDRWVLTAGRNLFVRKSRQDIQGKYPIIPKVYLGISRKAEAGASEEVAVEKVVLHPGFQNRSDWDNDLALIKLKNPVIMSDKVTPIPLPERGQDLENIMGGSGVITGWGWGVHLTPATSLKHLVLLMANHSDCKAEYERSELTPAVDDNMFCTGPTKFEENVCFGDAGGALAVRDAQTGDVYAAGILSYDKSCRSNKYGVYMKVSSYLPWIHSIIRGDTEKSSLLRSDAMSKMYAWQP